MLTGVLCFSQLKDQRMMIPKNSALSKNINGFVNEN